MKKKIAILSLIFISFMIFMSCNSCSSSSGQEFIKEKAYLLLHDTIYNKQVISDDTNFYLLESFIDSDEDTLQKLIIIKKIDPIYIDTLYKLQKLDSISINLSEQIKRMTLLNSDI
jgi:hypothetical protein